MSINALSDTINGFGAIFAKNSAQITIKQAADAFQFDTYGIFAFLWKVNFVID